MLRALNDARPESIITVLQDVLTKQFGATKVDVLLVNYQLAARRFRSIASPSEPVDDSAAGRAFTTQEPIKVPDATGKLHVYLPVSVGGDCIGVLKLAMPGPLDDGQLDQLKDLATLVGYALIATRKQDLLHRAGRSQRMTLAAELQWQLLPAGSSLTPQYQLAGHLEPAYAVYADNFDWSQNENTLMVSVTDAGIHARSRPLLSTLAVTAVRNARRAGLSVADQACMADQAIYAHHGGKHSVDTIILSIDITTGLASAVKAGSPQLVLLRDGVRQPVDLADQIPLGMFEGTEYAMQSFALATGDRLLVMSDGVTGAFSTCSESHPHEQLRGILATTLNYAPARVVRTVIDALIEISDNNGLNDDATVVCLDWEGPGQPSSFTLTAPDIRLREYPAHLQVVPTTPDSTCGD